MALPLARARRPYTAQARPKERQVITLKLTETEATVLHAIFVRVGGDPEGLRGWVNQMDTKLEVQIQENLPYGIPYLKTGKDLEGTIHFLV